MAENKWIIAWGYFHPISGSYFGPPTKITGFPGLTGCRRFVKSLSRLLDPLKAEMALIVQGRRCVSMESALIRGWNQWFREDESILTNT